MNKEERGQKLETTRHSQNTAARLITQGGEPSEKNQINLSNHGLTFLNSTLLTGNSTISDLDLSNNQLQDIPANIIIALPHLKSLCLKGNPITADGLPNELAQLKHLEELNISHCRLLHIPAAVWRYKRIRRLYASNNHLEKISSNLGKLTVIQSLDLRYNKLEGLPEELIFCQNLEEVLLMGNPLKSLPATLEDLPRLSNLTFNPQTFAEQISKYTDELLATSKIPSSHIPSVLFRIPSITCIILDCVKLNCIPNIHGESLQELSLSGNYFNEIPKSVTRLKSLRKLDISSNQIQSIPDEIRELTHLQCLLLNDNSITEVSSSIKYLKQLEVLNLTKNLLQEIPQEIGYVDSLKTLHLGKNQLQRIPDDLSLLTNLEILDVSDNQLLCIPSNIYNLSNLKSMHNYDNLTKKGLWLHNNQIGNYPSQNLNATNIAPLYEESRRKCRRLENRITRRKIIIFGNETPAKSKLYDFMKSSKHKINGTLPTEQLTEVDIVRNVKCTTSNNIPILLQQINGHERFRAVHPLLLDPSALYLLVNDCSQESTDPSMAYWVKLHLCYVPEAVVKVILMNDKRKKTGQDKKTDRDMKDDKTLNKKKEKSTDWRNCISLQKNDLDNMETIDDVLLELLPNAIHLDSPTNQQMKQTVWDIEDILATNIKFEEHLTSIPDSWLKLQKWTKRQPGISMTFKQFMKKSETFKIKDASQCLRYLYQTGQVIWLEYHPKSSHLIFHRPSILLKLVSCIYKQNFAAFASANEMLLRSVGRIKQSEIKGHIDAYQNSGYISGAVFKSLTFNSEFETETAKAVLQDLLLGYRKHEQLGNEQDRHNFVIYIPTLRESDRKDRKNDWLAKTSAYDNQYIMVIKSSKEIPSLWKWQLECLIGQEGYSTENYEQSILITFSATSNVLVMFYDDAIEIRSQASEKTASKSCLDKISNTIETLLKAYRGISWHKTVTAI